MSKAKFEVMAPFDSQKLTRGTITIDRENGVVSVRVHRRHKEYTTTLADIAAKLYRESVMKEVQEGRKKPRKRLVKRGLLSLS